MEMYFCPLYSGSSGNALFLQAGKTRLLIDAGKTGSCISAALEKIGEDSARMIFPTSRTRLLHRQGRLHLVNLQTVVAIHPDLRQKRIMEARVRIAVAVRHTTEVRRHRKKHSPSVQKRKRACMASCRWFLALSAH